MTSSFEYYLFGTLVHLLLGGFVLDIIGINLALGIGVPLVCVLSFNCLVSFFFLM